MGEVRLAGEGGQWVSAMGPGGVKSPGSRGAKSWAGGGRGGPGVLERVPLQVMIRLGVWMAEMGQGRWRRVMEAFIEAVT